MAANGPPGDSSQFLVTDGLRPWRGFGKPGCDIIMPVAPRLALFTQVGKKHERDFEFSSDHTRIVQRLLVERAFRWVFARQPFDWVETIRPRRVDPQLFEEERRAKREWNAQQSASERRFSDESAT